MRRTKPGYTLMELMIVVVLIGIITAAAAPQIVQGVSNNTVSEAVYGVVNCFRAARTRAMQQGRAMGVFVSNNGGVQLIRVDRGGDTSCDSMPACTTMGPDFGGPDCGLRWLDLNDGHFHRRGVRLRTLSYYDENGVRQDGVSTARFCVLPRGSLRVERGDTWVRVAPVILSIDRTGGGVVRRIMVNSMGLPRVTM